MRLIQYNLGAANDRLGSWADRATSAAAAIAAEDIDVVVVQGGADGEGDTAPLDLFLGELTAFTNIARHAGMAIASRLPLGEPTVRALSRQEGHEDPFARALLAVDVGGVTIINAHLSWVEAQAVDNVAAAIALAGDLGGHALVVGDMNQQPASPAMAMLEAAGFHDAWVRLRHGEPGLTFEVGSLWGRIDYIWERGDPSRITAIDAFDGGDGVSDHLGLIAELSA